MTFKKIWTDSRNRLNVTFKPVEHIIAARIVVEDRFQYGKKWYRLKDLEGYDCK